MIDPASADRTSPHKQAAGGRKMAWHRRLVRVRPIDRPTASAMSVLHRLANYPPTRSRREEFANTVTHGLGAAAAVLGGIWLIVTAAQTASLTMLAGCAAYACTLSAVMIFSTLSHAVRQPHWRHVFRSLDQASIYLLTAGSCTPYFLRYLSGTGYDWMLPTIWTLSCLGCWTKLCGYQVNRISLPIYIVLGWFPMIAAYPLFTQMPAACSLLVVLTGVCYMLGTIFLANDHRHPGYHSVWHILVLIGCGCCYFGALLYVAPGG